MWKEQVRGSGDAVGPRNHISYHLSEEDVGLLNSYATSGEIPRYQTIIVYALEKHKLSPDEDHKEYRIKFLLNGSEAPKGEIFECAAIAAGIDLTDKPAS